MRFFCNWIQFTRSDFAEQQPRIGYICYA